MEIRIMTAADYDAVFALWKNTSGMGLNNLDDSREGVEKYLRRNPTTSFVAVDGGEIVGCILAGYDGRRGFIHHAAVRGERRREGIGTALVNATLEALKAEGINKVALFVMSWNELGDTFWENRGFELRSDVNTRSKIINESLDYD